MNILFSTLQRKADYLPKTLATLLLTEALAPEIHLMVDGDKIDYLKDFSHKRIKIHQLSAEDLEKKSSYKYNSQRAAHNYWRCLTFDKSQPALICEDDIIFKDGAFWFLEYAIKNLQDNSKYMLVLGHNQIEHLIEPNPKIQTWQPFTFRIFQSSFGLFTNTWANTWAVYFSEPLLQSGLSDFVYKYSVKDEGFYDLAIGIYCMKNNIPIYILHPPLVEHRGILSEFGDSLKIVTDDRYNGCNSDKIKSGHLSYDGWDWKNDRETQGNTGENNENQLL